MEGRGGGRGSCVKITEMKRTPRPKLRGRQLYLAELYIYMHNTAPFEALFTALVVYTVVAVRTYHGGT